MDKRAIGVFDSGVGGLSAVRQLHALLPNEDIIYFGDTGRVPYGTRSKETICKYAQQDIKYLLKHDVKIILAACGTVSSVFSEADFAALGADIPFTGVLLPAAKDACALSTSGRIGVIATTAAIRTGAYGRAVRAISSNFKVLGKACPLLVPLAENGMIGSDNKITRLTLEMYLAPLIKEEIDTLILGCTHFPLFYDIINEILDYKVTIVDSGESGAKSVQNLLCTNALLSENTSGGKTHYYVTDTVESFLPVAQTFICGDLKDCTTFVNIDELEL